MAGTAIEIPLHFMQFNVSIGMVGTRDHAVEINPDWDVVQEGVFSLKEWLQENPPGTYHHYHTADEIQYGVLPIEHGGLGAGTIADALRGIGISPLGHTHDISEITGVLAGQPVKIAMGTGTATAAGNTVSFDDAAVKLNYSATDPFVAGKTWVVITGGSTVQKIYIGDISTTSFRAYSDGNRQFSYLAIGATA